MADKLLLTAVYVTLAYRGFLPAWVFVVIFSRDLLIVLGWAVIYILTGSSKVAPRTLGKVTTGIQMATVVGFLMLPDASPLRSMLLWSTVFATAASAIDYVYIGEKRLGDWN
jgi:cardiolipin synthase